MINPASTVPLSTASSISEKSNSILWVALGYAKLSKKLAVVNLPGIAIFRSGIRALIIAVLAIKSGPQLLPKALPASSKT